MWTLVDSTQREIIDEIERELKRDSDRSAGLIAGAFVEQRLEAAIRGLFERNPDVENKMFSGVGPLATFSAKIDLGLCLGLYDEGVWRALHTIRKIRNEFAHKVGKASFESQRVLSLCNNLTVVSEDKFVVAPKRAIDRAMKTGQMTKPLIMKLVMSQIFNATDTPRNRFIASVKGLLLLLRLAELLGAQRAREQPLPFSSSKQKAVGQIRRVIQSGNRKRKRRARQQKPSLA